MLLLSDGDRAVVVAMTIMLVVQVAINKIIHMVAMWDRFVSTAWAVNMVGRVTGAGVT
jgi:hypothetical protein